MFKSIVPAIVIASALAVPALAQASDNGALTRAEVKAQLVQLERAGYNPASDHTTYPANIQAAQAPRCVARRGGDLVRRCERRRVGIRPCHSPGAERQPGRLQPPVRRASRR